ncbi:hypothetical protein TrRE_jg5009 [Triparma retinervis]|uniref:STAS domain-containing protein n=1 Tax=Triparma retinervis TaxID=2557542 RepID=A0A9W7F5P6_9STRA|nr:hypothetical protein TrRE_jg5009 [Triparma retinervis]
MMMVENTSFQHALAQSVATTAFITEGGSETCPDTVLPTVLLSFTLTTLLTSLAFFLLGYFNLGKIVYFFPKHVILGCISGIGVFVVQTGLEVSKGTDKIEWTLAGLERFFATGNQFLFVLPVLLVIALRALLRISKKLSTPMPLLPPLFFLSVTPLFYLTLYLLSIDLSTARASGFFFPETTPTSPPPGSPSPYFNDGGVPPTSFSSLFFPSYSLLQTPTNPFSLIDLNALFRTMPTQVGCVLFSLMHVPINIPSMSMSVGVDVDMSTEDQGFDRLERFSISLIVITMTLGGMTAGLFVGMIMASVTFVVNAGTHLHPIRGSMRASTLRSSKWRTPRAWKTLISSSKLRRTLCVQLQGHLYFANINLFADEIKALLLETPNWFNYIILDFTLVLGVDSSAAFALIKLVDQMKPRKLRWISFVTGKEDGFPCTVNLSEQLQRKAGVGIKQNLDQALSELEDLILEEKESGLANEIIMTSPEIARKLLKEGESSTLKHILTVHCPTAALSTIDALSKYFERRDCPPHTILWKQDSAPEFLAVILSGSLLSTLEEEAGTKEDVAPGDIIGEFSLTLAGGEREDVTR